MENPCNLFKNHTNSLKFCQKSVSEMILGSQMVKIWLKRCQDGAKGRPSDPKVGPRRPKVAPRMAKGGPLEAKMVPKGSPGKHFGGKYWYQMRFLLIFAKMWILVFSLISLSKIKHFQGLAGPKMRKIMKIQYFFKKYLSNLIFYRKVAKFQKKNEKLCYKGGPRAPKGLKLEIPTHSRAVWAWPLYLDKGG